MTRNVNCFAIERCSVGKRKIKGAWPSTHRSIDDILKEWLNYCNKRFFLSGPKIVYPNSIRLSSETEAIIGRKTNSIQEKSDCGKK
ncbi:MAG TPA: hypothetical protein PK990_07880 [Salinivirgaceae bacterium]|nr:hypothetical protein [Salinivirgaceae bacterium]